MIQLNTSGVWGVQVLTTANSLSNWVYINGNNIPINQATQIGIFTVNASGESGDKWKHLSVSVANKHLCSLYMKNGHPRYWLVTLLHWKLWVALHPITHTGWFNFELRIAYPMANVRYNLLFKSPKAVAYSSYFGFLSMSPVAFTLPDYAPNAQLSSLWQVRL